jgi:acyl carrier protein
MQHDNDMDDLELIRGFLKNRIDAAMVDKIVPEATLTELGIDSLMQIELLFEFEDQTGINVPTDLPPPKTVGELLQQLKEIRSQQVTK